MWCSVYHPFRQPSQDEMAWNEKLSFWPHVASICVLQVADNRSLATVLVQWTSVAWPTTRSSLQWNISSSVGERLSGNILERILSFFIHTVWFCAKCLARSDCLDVESALHWITTLRSSCVLSWEKSPFSLQGCYV